MASASDQRIALARHALIRTGYFRPSEVGDDIAPRITELWSYAMPKEKAARELFAAASDAHGLAALYYPDAYPIGYGRIEGKLGKTHHSLEFMDCRVKACKKRRKALERADLL